VVAYSFVIGQWAHAFTDVGDTVGTMLLFPFTDHLSPRGRGRTPGRPGDTWTPADPPPIVPTDLGGAWSSYWYNGYIYETNITEGLNIFE
jgi:hypothetical protein